jgi:hypothetical protein
MTAIGRPLRDGEHNTEHPELYYMEAGYFSSKEDAAANLVEHNTEDGYIMFPRKPMAGGEAYAVFSGAEIRYYQNDKKQGPINDVGYVYKAAKGWVAYHIA